MSLKIVPVFYSLFYLYIENNSKTLEVTFKNVIEHNLGVSKICWIIFCLVVVLWYGHSLRFCWWFHNHWEGTLYLQECHIKSVWIICIHLLTKNPIIFQNIPKSKLQFIVLVTSLCEIDLYQWYKLPSCLLLPPLFSLFLKTVFLYSYSVSPYFLFHLFVSHFKGCCHDYRLGGRKNIL